MKFDLGIVKPINLKNQTKFDGFLDELVAKGLSIGIVDINSFVKDENIVKVRSIRSNEIVTTSLSEFRAVHALDFEQKDELTISLKEKWLKVFQFYSVLEDLSVRRLNSFHCFNFFRRKDYLFECQKTMPNNVIPTFSSFRMASRQYKNIVAKPINGECSRDVRSNFLESEIYPVENYIFQPNVSSDNFLEEFSLLYFDNACVNAVQRSFEWKENERKLHNVSTTSYDFSNEEVELGLKFMNTLDEKVRPKIWRFDFIKRGGNNLLMELEAVDPYHYEDFASNDYWNKLEKLYYEII